MNDEAGILETTPAGRWARLPRLTDAGLLHAFSCRSPGGACPPAAELAARAAAYLGRPRAPRRRLRQRHTAVVHRADGAAAPDPPPVGDALATRQPGLGLTLGTADCLPLLILDPGAPALAVVHAGWRGLLAGILPRTLEVLEKELGAVPSRLLLGIGPAIRACCFEVGPEVIDAFAGRWPGASRWVRPGRGRPHLDLAAAARDQAVRGGVPSDGFLDPGWCTRCRTDLFHSYRAEGPGGGRIVTLALLREEPGTMGGSGRGRVSFAGPGR